MFQDTEFGKELGSFPCTSSEAGGNIVATLQPQQGNQRVSQRGQVLWSLTFLDLAGIFLERDVADVVGAVLDAPMLAPPA